MREKLGAISIGRLRQEGFLSKHAYIHRWSELVRGFSDFLLQKAYTTLLSAYDVLKTEENLQRLMDQLPSRLSSKPLTVLLSQNRDFLTWIRHHKHHDMLTNQMNIDVNAEKRHILLLEASLETHLTLVTYKTKIDDDDEQLFTEISLYETESY